MDGRRRKTREGKRGSEQRPLRISNPEDNHRISSYRIFVFTGRITASQKKEGKCDYFYGIS